MDIWLVAVLAAWVPVAVVLAVLVGRTLVQDEARMGRALVRIHPRADPRQDLGRMREHTPARRICG